MTFTPAKIVDVVELVCYAPILPVVAFLAYRHGRRGLLGYFYLNAACLLRVIYDIVSLVMKTPANGVPSLGTTILGSIGLTPLLLVWCIFSTHSPLMSADNCLLTGNRRLSPRGSSGSALSQWRANQKDQRMAVVRSSPASRGGYHWHCARDRR